MVTCIVTSHIPWVSPSWCCTWSGNPFKCLTPSCPLTSSGPEIKEWVWTNRLKYLGPNFIVGVTPPFGWRFFITQSYYHSYLSRGTSLKTETFAPVMVLCRSCRRSMSAVSWFIVVLFSLLGEYSIRILLNILWFFFSVTIALHVKSELCNNYSHQTCSFGRN